MKAKGGLLSFRIPLTAQPHACALNGGLGLNDSLDWS